MKDIAILIPAYNPDEKLIALLDALRTRVPDVVVVNDGSTAGREIFEKISAGGITVLAHDVNRGKGAALKTGFRWIMANLPSCAAVVTADADGQHRPDDILRVAEAALANPQALTLGVRMFSGKVPLRSRFGNWWTRQFFFLATHMRVSDTQTGLRGIPASLFPRMLTIPGDRYEYEMAMLTDARHYPAPPVQVPIETIYLESNASSHFNPLRDSVRIYGALIRFCLSSVGCFLLDNIIFTVLLYMMSRMTDWKRATGVLVSIIAARAVSATVNYACNRKLVFRSDVSRGTSFLKYWVLVLLVLVCGYGCTAVASRIFDAHGFFITFLKILVETGLFFLSYSAQKHWIFHGSPA